MDAAASQDLYATLGVARGASQDEIKTAYRTLARKLHPDVNPGNRQAEERFKEVGAAFEVLGDPEKRKLYDEFGEDALRSGFDPEQARAYRAYHTWRRTGGAGGGRGVPPDLQDLLGGIGGMGAGFDLGDLFGGLGGARGMPRDRRGGDVTADMAVTLREAVLGVERELAFERPVPLDGPPGKGERTRLKVKVPAGIEDGQTIRLAGQGLAGTGKGATGDLLIRVHVAGHPHVKRVGRDLELELPVTVREAMLGAKIEVPTFQGSIKLTVPAGSQTGTRLRARGKGVAAHGREPAGDLYVVLAVQVPNPAADAQRAERAAELLDGLYAGDPRAGLRL